MQIDNDEITISGKFVKIVQFREEWDVDVDDPELVISKLKASNVNVDIFTFRQRLPESKPKFNYYMEWDSIAAIPITTYENWLKNQVVQNSRKKIGLAKRKNVEVRICEFNDNFVKSQLEIYHESPIRQGRPNWDYNIDFETAKKANATFLDRATFLGAFLDEELIGFIKIVDAGIFMRTMGILGKNAHRDKAPMNILVAKAVEICAARKKTFLTYSKFNYGKVGSNSIKEFKRNLGFESILLPRYYVPANTWGALIIKLRLHQSMVELLPTKLIYLLLELRSKWYARKYKNIT